MSVPTMDSPDVPLVNGSWQYTSYVSTDNLIMPEVKRRETIDSKNLGFRLRRRKELIGRRTRACDIACFLAIFGIIIVIIDTELQFSGIFTIKTPASIYLRAITSVATIGLLASLVAYHVIGIHLRIISQGHNSWKLAIAWQDVAKLAAELSICAIHPLPFSSKASIPMYVSDVDEIHRINILMFPLNSMFTVLMFLRIYLLGRFLVVHSDLFCDTTVQSLGAMSNVNINAQFVFKALMSSMPGLCLIAIMGTTLFVNSYSLRLCEYYTLGDHQDTFFMQAIWMTCVTFLTLGYGDIVPRTTCGRVLAIGTGLMGVGIMALCVAVLSRKLEQSRGEKYVHTFVQQIRMDKQYKNAAAKVITQALTLWRLRRHGVSQNDDQMITHKRRLNHAVKDMNRSQYMKTQFAEYLVGPVEINKNVNEVYDLVENIKEDQETFKTRMANMEHMMKTVHTQLLELRDNMKRTEPDESSS